MQNKKKERKKAWLGLASILSALAMLAVFLSPYVGAAGGTTTMTGQVTVVNACAFTENVATIQFVNTGQSGSAGIIAGTNTIGTANTVAVTNTGQSNSNVLIYGASWTWSTPTGASYSNTIYSSTANSAWNPIASTALQLSGVEVRMAGTQVDTGITVNTASPNTISLGLAIPSTTPAGAYTQTIDFVSSC
jgi:hypothetical protein